MAMQVAADLMAPGSALRSGFSRMGNWLVDLVFPPVCNCGRVDYAFCADCLEALQSLPLDAQMSPSEALNGLAWTGRYDGILREAIRAFKYAGVTGLDRRLARRLQRAYQQTGWTLDLIIPVPLAEKRLEHRGYNQATLLAACLSELCAIACRTDLLRRLRETDQQAQLNAEQRLENVRDAFEATEEVEGRSILLVDDVASTGATLAECARALQRQGASAVYGITVARP